MPNSPISNRKSPSIVMMGVSGCGKSTVAEAFAQALNWPLFEGDVFHSALSIRKMSVGIALTDDDRAGWLDHLAGLLAPRNDVNGIVLTCSALRRKYRDRLRAGNSQLGFVFLELPYEAALQRVQSRSGHFFTSALVADQFATLENPVSEPDVLMVNAMDPIDVMTQQVVAWAQRSGWAPCDSTMTVGSLLMDSRNQTEPHKSENWPTNGLCLSDSH
ncbi:gluconokinase [Cupriavidus necator]